MNPFVRIFTGLLLLLSAVHGSQELQVFLADNHAETAACITRNFDLDAPHVLVLVDAHSDASAAEQSEEIREQLRRVPSETERANRVEGWRKNGRIQAFNWIEPLLPRPLDHVLWLAAPTLTPEDRLAKLSQTVNALDGRLEVEPRSAGSFERRWDVCDLKGFREWQPGTQPVILAIDLDFFVGMKPLDREAHFTAIWRRAMDWQGLAGVAFSISRPWLTDDSEADALVALALDAVLHTRGARLEIDAALDDRPDRSLQAAALPQPVPRWDFGKISSGVRERLGLLGERLTITNRLRQWQPTTWHNDAPAARILATSGELDLDGVWRFPLGEEPVLRLESTQDTTGKTRWYLMESARQTYDLLPKTGLGKNFSLSPGRWIYEIRRSLGETTDFQLDPRTWRRQAGGRFIISAEVETSRGWLPATSIELRIRTTAGFRGSISECAGMPYVFGIAGVTAGELSAVETGWGSDCANLFIHAWRRNGREFTWGDPGRLRSQLTTLTENITLAAHPPISSAAIERGIIIDFGKHVAAVWQDCEPLGRLGANDRVVHHLGGLSEITTLGELAATRPRFSLRVPPSPKICQIAFAGDVVLAGDDRVAIANFGRSQADAFVVNLEGIPAAHGSPGGARYNFRFPHERLVWLKSQGVDGVSLANNHAADARAQGISDGIEALRKLDIASFGAGANELEACRPWRLERNGVRLAIYGVSYFTTGAATATQAGVAVLPAHSRLLEHEFQRSHAAGEKVIILVHGGDEYDRRITAEQQHWARWLVARGVSVIAGSHPHVVQREEFHGGAVILHSLGNAVYPRGLKGADSGQIKCIDIGGDSAGRTRFNPAGP